MNTHVTKVVILLQLIIASGISVSAQSNTDKIDSKNKKEIQKKELDSIAEQSKTEYEFELQRLIEEQQKAMDEMGKHTEWQVVRPNRDFFKGKDFSFNLPDMPDAAVFDLRSGMNSGDNTSFNISKRLKDETTFNGDFEFTVPAKCRGVVFNFSGSLEAGSLKVSLTKPDKKVYQEFKVSPIADVRWNKKVKEDEIKELEGTWKIIISAQDAKGIYNINITSF